MTYDIFYFYKHTDLPVSWSRAFSFGKQSNWMLLPQERLLQHWWFLQVVLPRLLKVNKQDRIYCYSRQTFTQDTLLSWDYYVQGPFSLFRVTFMFKKVFFLWILWIFVVHYNYLYPSRRLQKRLGYCYGHSNLFGEFRFQNIIKHVLPLLVDIFSI